MENRNFNLSSIILMGLWLIFCANAQAASFDCTKASTQIEKLICSSVDVSGSDEMLGEYYREALVKYPDRKDMLVRQQRNWLKWIRSQCTSLSCLDTLYKARIIELIEGNNIAWLDGPNKPNFVITEGHGEAVCEEYLKVLNDTARDQLRACKLPDLSQTSIKPVEFNPLTGKQLKKVDQILYEQLYQKDWKEAWAEHEQEYISGYRNLAEAYWDLDEDGEMEQIIREQYPNELCSMLGDGRASEMWLVSETNWKSFTKQEKMALAKDLGYKNVYVLVEKGIASFVDAQNFIDYKGKKLSVSQYMLNGINTSNDWADKNWVEIWAIKPERKDDIRTYRRGPSICKFWLNN